MLEIEVFVIIDSEGSYVAHVNLSDAHELANDEGQEPTRRVVRVLLTMPAPEAIDVEATLPAESTEATVKVS
jgi:hypothetical protein